MAQDVKDLPVKVSAVDIGRKTMIRVYKIKADGTRYDTPFLTTAGTLVAYRYEQTSNGGWTFGYRLSECEWDTYTLARYEIDIQVYVV